MSQCVKDGGDGTMKSPALSVEDIRARERNASAILSQKDAQLRHIIGYVPFLCDGR